MRIGEGLSVPVTATSPPAAAAPLASGASHASSEPSASGPSPFARVLRGLATEIDQGERRMRRAVSAGGLDLGPGELLALQAGVYRYSEAVDLAAKLVDKTTNGIRTVVQGGQ